MHSLASFVMRGPLQAALVAGAVAVLSLLMPPILLLSGAAIVLVTLRLGLQQGLIVIGIATFGGGVLAWLALGSAWPLVWLSALYWVPLLILAMALRMSISLAFTLRFAALLGALAVFVFYLLFGNPEVWWTEFVKESFATINIDGATERDMLLQVQQGLTQIAPILPGLLVASSLASLLLAVLLGRWWQALLYNPGGFRDEFHELRLGKPMAIAMLLLLALSLLPALLPITNLVLVLGVIYVLQGIALVHALVAKVGLSKAWLVAFYLLLVTVFSQLVMILGALDAWIDFRTRIGRAVRRK